MKNHKLLLGSALLTGVVMFSASLYLNNTALYSPRTIQNNYESEDKEDAVGASQWLFNIQKNPLTGTIDPIDILNARAEAQQMASSRSSRTALGLDWTELGPDNVGGRTRALLIDKDNSNKMFAGGVAGGLWVSMDAGSTWNVVPGFDQQPNLAVASMTQAANGDIYVGTGEGSFYSNTGTGSSGILGGGIYKSTDGGASFSLLPSTIPVTSNSTSNGSNTAFISVAELASDPVNPNRIYAATAYGLRMSNNGGTTWMHPIRLGGGGANTIATDDIDVASDGTVFANVNSKLYISATGDSATFTSTSTGLPSSASVGRMEFAVAPSDPNYVYAVAGGTNDLLLGVYQSIDKGATWTTIGTGGSTQFEIFLSAFGQAFYDMALVVNPGNKYKIFAAGVSMWTWQQTSPSTPGVGQWSQAATSGFDSPTNPYYVHADVHDLKFKNSTTLYVGCDGGIFRSMDGGTTYQPVNNGYNVTQFYSLAFESNNTYGTGITGGAQDNGTQYIGGSGGNTSESAVSINGGDGFETEISFLNPNAAFSTVYYGALNRHSTKGAYGSSFYPAKIVTGSGAASFVTPIALYETKSATNSVDEVQFINEQLSQIVGTGNGINKRFTGVISLPYPSATLVPDSVEFKTGLQIISDDASGNLTGSISGTTNNINYATGLFDFTFATAPANGAIVNVTFDVMYNPGSAIDIMRADYVYPLKYVTTSTINPGDTVMVYDSIQAKLAVGFTGTVWMTKGTLDFSKTPAWFKLGNISGTVEELAWSNDGDVLYVGTSGGNLYRMSNLASIKDSVTGDISSPSTVVVTTKIAGFGQFITGLSVDPADKNKVAVSLGGYGQPNNVYYSTTASTCGSSASTTNFSLKQGIGASKLPAMPVYTVMIEKNDPKRVLVGTEYGVYSTSDITVANPVWSIENGAIGLFPRVPVFKLRQQRRDGSQVNNPYVIYAATHGRGAWKSETYKGAVTVGIKEAKGSKSTAMESGLSVYPNPMNGEGTIAFKLNSADDIMINIYTLQGKLVSSIKTGKLSSGDQKIAIDTDELAKGTYFVSVDGNSVHATSKFIVIK